MKRMRIWPAIVAPLGLTLLMGVAAWLFLAKVTADQEQADQAALRLESYARVEAGELVSRTRELAASFLGERQAKREQQERDMRVELRSVMDAVYRVLTAGLEKTRQAAGSPVRDVGEFPSGFESLRLFLELAGDGAAAEDAPVMALRACATELTALLPPGCSLSVVENNFEELLSLGGGYAMPENARTEAIAREFIWDDGTQSRHWTLQVRLSEADANPAPDAAELARHLDSKLNNVRLTDAAWRGWLIDADGQTTAFPQLPEGIPERVAGGPPPYTNMPGEWVDIDGRRLVWLEKGESLGNFPVTPAVTVAVDRPPAALSWREELVHDKRWGMTLGLLGLLTLGTWLWFARALLTSRRRSASDKLEQLLASRPQNLDRRKTGEFTRVQDYGKPAVPRTPTAALPAVGARPSGDGSRRRLPEDVVARRDLTDAVEEVVVPQAVSRDDGLVAAERTPVQLTIPSGSLLRLQEKHRGGKGRRGSRALDGAKSQLLREMAKRVRPVLMTGPSAPPPPPPETGPTGATGGTKRVGRTTDRLAPRV